MNNDCDPAALGCNEELGQAPKRDIVERLRTRNGSPTGFGLGPVCDEAADEIERLRARVLELEAVHEDASGAVLEERERYATALRTAREGYASEAATGLPVLPQWRDRAIALIDEALRTNAWLGPLPEPAHFARVGDCEYRDCWNAQQVRAYALAEVSRAVAPLLAALQGLLSAVQRSVCEGSGPAQEAAHAAINRALGRAA